MKQRKGQLWWAGHRRLIPLDGRRGDVKPPAGLGLYVLEELTGWRRPTVGELVLAVRGAVAAHDLEDALAAKAREERDRFVAMWGEELASRRDERAELRARVADLEAELATAKRQLENVGAYAVRRFILGERGAA